MGLDITVKLTTENGEETEADFRKFNALLNYVQHLEPDYVNCDDFEFDHDDLREMYAGVVKSLQTKEPFLKTTQGFFFGSTSYNEYYWNYCEQLVELLSPAVKDSSIRVTFWAWW